MMRGAEAEDALLGAALLLVAASAAERGVEAILVERLLEALGLPHVGMDGAVIERIDPGLFRLGIAIDDQLHAGFRRGAVPKRVHVPELPGRVDMKQRKVRRRRVKGLAREVKHHRTVLASRIEHHRAIGLGNHLTQDVDALRLEPFEMGQADRIVVGPRSRDTPVFHRSIRLPG